jgi:hypothetical protein
MDKLLELGFTSRDVVVCSLCVTASVFGSAIDYMLRRDDFENYPQHEPVSLDWKRITALIFGRVFYLGVVAGVATFLMFYGSMSPTPMSYCRWFLLAGWAGFTAPDLAIRLRKKPFPAMPT